MNHPPKKGSREDQVNSRPDKPVWVVVVGALALLVAIGASGVLVMDHVGALSAPGCGGESDCHSAANGKFGSIPMFGTYCSLRVGLWECSF